MKNKTWLWIFAAVALGGLLLAAALVIWVDPYMHYHRPLTDTFYYTLSNQRSQNDGITKFFDYDALITGTSMTENFKTSEFDSVFGVDSIKVSYSGGTYKEVNDNLMIALETHPNIRYIVRSLDRYKIVIDKDAMRTDLGRYPTYLYDRDPFNDVEYVLNKDRIAASAWMLLGRLRAEPAGITTFDGYSNWMDYYTFGANTVIDSHWLMYYNFRVITAIDSGETARTERVLTEEEKQKIRENVEQNITALADAYPNTQFCYFLPPYSAVYWGDLWADGELQWQLACEEYMASLIVSHENIHLFAWERFDLFDDLNNFKDSKHYGEWINSWMLTQMKNGTGRLTSDNYEEYFQSMYDHYSTFDYSSLLEQEDYEDDYYAAELLAAEIQAVEP